MKMTALHLIENQFLLIDYIFGKISKEKEVEIDKIISSNAELAAITDDLIYLSVVLNLNDVQLKEKINSINKSILSSLPK